MRTQQEVDISSLRIHNQKETHSSLFSKSWWYTKQAIKGVTVLGLGVVVYSWLRRGSTRHDKATDQIGKGKQSKLGLAKSTTHQRGKRASVGVGGNEFWVNTTSTHSHSPSIASLSNGDFVVSWEQLRANLLVPEQNCDPAAADFDSYHYNKHDIYLQRYSSGGIKLSREFQASNSTESSADSSITPLSNGGFVVTWLMENDVLGQLYSSNETELGSRFLVNMPTVSRQRAQSVARLDNGGFVVVRNQENPVFGATFEHGIYVQRFSSNGTRLGSGFRVNTNTPGIDSNIQGFPSITGLSNGGFVVVWQSQGYTGGYGVYGQRIGPNGTKQGSKFLVDMLHRPTLKSFSPSVTSLSNGDFVVVWKLFEAVDRNTGIYGQRYNLSGMRLGNRFLVNTFTRGRHYSPVIKGLSNGDFVVVWTWGWKLDEYYDCNRRDRIYAQRFTGLGTKLGCEFQVSIVTKDFYERTPSVAELSNGEFVVSWVKRRAGKYQYDSVYARIFPVGYIGAGSVCHVDRTQLSLGLGVGVPALLTAGVLIGVIWKKRTNATNHRTREDHELADRIRHHLMLSGVDNFEKGKGAAFVVAIEGIEKRVSKKRKKGNHSKKSRRTTVVVQKGLVHYLNERGINVREMQGNEIGQLAQEVAVCFAGQLPSRSMFAKRQTIDTDEFTHQLKKLAKKVQKKRESGTDEIESRRPETSIELESVSY